MKCSKCGIKLLRKMPYGKECQSCYVENAIKNIAYMIIRFIKVCVIVILAGSVIATIELVTN